MMYFDDEDGMANMPHEITARPKGTAPSCPHSPDGTVVQEAIPYDDEQLERIRACRNRTCDHDLVHPMPNPERLIARIDAERAARLECIGNPASSNPLEQSHRSQINYLGMRLRSAERERLTERATRRIADDAINRFGLRLSDWARLAGMIIAARGQKDSDPSVLGPHDWTHPADACDEPSCDHITRRTCEGAERLTRWLRDTLRKRTERLCELDPVWARKAAMNVLHAAFGEGEDGDHGESRAHGQEE